MTKFFGKLEIVEDETVLDYFKPFIETDNECRSEDEEEENATTGYNEEGLILKRVRCLSLCK